MNLNNLIPPTATKCLFATSLLMLTVSCTTYQYVSLNSNLPQKDGREFFHENSEVSVHYFFSGENCPLTIEITNKTKGNIFVNWGMSSVIFDDQSYCLSSDMQTQSLLVSNDSTIQHIFQESLYKQNMGFVPPGSKISYSPMNLVNEWLPVNATDSLRKDHIYTGTSSMPVKKHIYNSVQSPLYFRCFITYADNYQMDQPKTIDDEFWAAEIYKKQISPDYILPNQYYISKTTGFGNFMISLGALTILIVSVLASTADTGE